MSNIKLYILDRHQQPVPVGVTGEVYIGGVGIARGYLNRPDLSSERFLPDPFSARHGDARPGARMYKTGDLARFLPDGIVEFLGRSDQQVKVRGFRIELAEVEAALQHHPALREVVVLAREDAGDQSLVARSKRLVAYITGRDQEAMPTVGELRSFLQGRLPDYMVPPAFVVLDALPLTPVGKVDRKALGSAKLSTAPDAARSESGPGYVAPRNEREQILAGIWAEVLQVDAVSAEDNFFELGGDSILSIQVIARANQAGLRLSPKQLFQAPTVAGLAALAEITPSTLGPPR